RFPLLGFIELSDILSVNALTLVVKRTSNTVKFYIKEKECLQNISPLIFPFKMREPGLLKTSSGSYFPFPRMYMIGGGKHDLLDFILKEDIEQLELSITKVAGKFIATGTAVDSEGHKGAVMVFNPQKFLMINLEKNPSIYIELLEPLPKQISMSSNFPVFEESGVSIGVDNFDPLQHTVIAGTSGSGKSKALFVLLKALEAKYKDKVRIIVVDPHGEFAKMMPHSRIVNFVDNYVEPLDVGRDKSPMLTQLVSQLIASSIGQENKYSERVLFYTVHLLSSIGKLELGNISALLTDPAVKAEYVSMCDNDEVKRFFDEEFNDIHIHHFNNAILPILNFIGEYQLYLGKEKKRESLLDMLSKNRVSIVSFDPKFFGRRMISFLAGSVINQMYILAISGKLQDKPTILVVDEFPRVETRVTKDILAETRKFNLFAYLSCQYLGQLSKEVTDSIVSNARNIVAFKINKQDATMLSSIMEIKVEEYFKKNRATTELEESKKEMFVRLHQRECIVRLFDGAKYLLPMKVRIVDARKWGLQEGYVPETGKPSEAPKFSDRPQEPPLSNGGRGLRYQDARGEDHGEGGEAGAQTQAEASEDGKTEEKPEKPELPGPMEEHALLRETPEAIYHLEKAQMAAERSVARNSGGQASGKTSGGIAAGKTGSGTTKPSQGKSPGKPKKG
ncbi:MAG: type IV secretion system DNA-binding domain-containing protein, partial [Candidatus ainarchaeum sp.]|nr:type IV secretion system DNA-binding domain-containing protein [Candidatus ainarchaeum sp.]